MLPRGLSMSNSRIIDRHCPSNALDSIRLHVDIVVCVCDISQAQNESVTLRLSYR